MAAKTLTFDIFGRDKTASKAIKGVGASADDMGVKLGKLGKVMGVGLAAAGAGAVAFGIDSLKVFVEAQAAQVKLQDAFDRFPAMADTNIQKLGKLNSALAKKTRFDDDATSAGQAVLAQYKLSGKQIERLTPLMQDYAAKTGRELPDAAKVLGKAMLGQGKALKDVGIQFTDTKDLAGNFDQVMGSLNEKVGGFAEKDGASAAGRAEILKNRFGEIQEKIGEALIPALDEAAKSFEETLMPQLEDTATWMAETGIPKLNEFTKGFQAVQQASYDFGYAIGPNLQVAYDALFKFGQDIEPITSGWFDFWYSVGENVGKVTSAPAERDIWGNDIMGDGKTAAPIVKDPGFKTPSASRRTPKMRKLPALANGGTALAAGIALIGERGPELISMPKGASVIPLERAGSAGGGGRSFVQNIYPTPGMSEETVGRIAGNSMNTQMRRLS